MSTTPTQTSTVNRRSFDLGQLFATPGGRLTVHPEDRTQALTRHAGCDWGSCGPEDWADNELSLEEGCRLHSVYQDRHGIEFWIITEADRSVTTILLPDEY